MMSSFRIEIVMKGLCSYHTFVFFGKLQYRVAVYFLLHGIKPFLNHWERVFYKKLSCVLASR